jgi:hypothetical protein
VEWQLPHNNTIHRLLTNPVYAGAYVFGRTGSQVRIEAGRKLITRGVRRSQKEWESSRSSEGYISWQDYENNQRIIKGNANMKGEMVPGSVAQWRWLAGRPAALWTLRTRFIDDERIEIDTNTVEHSIKPIGLGKKNYLFAGSEGTETWAILASIINTAKLHDIDLQRYLSASPVR